MNINDLFEEWYEENIKKYNLHKDTCRLAFIAGYNARVKQMDNEVLKELDDCIENMRSMGIDDKYISMNLATAAGLVKQKKWDKYFHEEGKE